ncbi:hypothetical protein FIE12Z_4903 [Fusarium flagelliforme]|uniref:Apple domain-containing protein n=1 Tax=Fusarium flagelliforme TaxID=2675880 RepID=A0A395MT03_9HYPO|nr:hypothetical protein FIE12Z_4903 [Fusarium flagelliforme]
MKLRHSILALCASTATAAPTSSADNNPLSVRALTCAQMGGSYTSAPTNTKFTVICKSTPNAAIPLSFLRTLSFDACLDACASLPLCVAAVYNSGFNDCNLYAAAGGVRSNPAYDFAVKAEPDPEPQPTTTAEATTSEPTTEAGSTTTAYLETTSSEIPTSEVLSVATSQATVDSTEVTSSIESTTVATTSEVLSTATTSTETSTAAKISTIPAESSTSEATTVPETATTSEELTISGTTTILETASLETSASFETSTMIAGTTTTDSGSSSTSEVPTETDDCDDSSNTEPTSPTSTLQPSETATTLTASATMTHDIPPGSESSSIASQSDSAVSSPCTTETQAATETSDSETVPDYGLPVTATSQYALPPSKVITVTEGGYVITKTVSCDTPSGTNAVVQGSSGGTNDYQTRTGHGGDVEVQPMTGSHNYLPPNHEDGGAYGSIDNHQTPTGHNGYADAQPTAGSHTNVHSQYVSDLPTGTGHNVHVEAQPTHGASLPDYKYGHSYAPVPSQGQHNKPQPDHENVQASDSIHHSPEGNNHGGPYPTQGHVAQSITAAPKPGNASPVTQGHEAASTTLATEAVVTNEAEAPKSTHGGDSSKAGEEPVSISGANRYQAMGCTWMAIVMGLMFI